MDAGAALKRQCPESPPNMVASFFTRVSRYCDLPKIAPTCALFATWPGPAQAIGSLALAFRETGFPRAETDGSKSAPGGKKSPRRLNRLRQSPPIAGLWLVSGKSSGSKDCVVGPGDVPLVCDFKQLRCPTALNTHAERKRQFGPLSNLSPNIELRPGRGRIRKIDATRRTVREVKHSRPSDIS
jgi:hypothetical protein